MSEVKLRNCPCCGGKAFVNARRYWDEKAKDFTVYTYGVTCYDCQTGTWPYYRKEEDAIERWNTRKPIDNIVERLEEHKSYNQMMLKKFPKMGTIENAIYKTQRDTYENAIEIVKGGVED